VGVVQPQTRQRELVSVVIAAFNAQDWISETLQSVLAQTYKNIEIIIVDDGSTDRTFAIAEMNLQSSPFSSRILRQNNLGVSAALRRDMQAGRGRRVVPETRDAGSGLHQGRNRWSGVLVSRPTKVTLKIQSARFH
jgi:cellulose synthase/poly-beta-1,6-N-acetylglucosamine synthase-like glycosyltransferase